MDKQGGIQIQPGILFSAIKEVDICHSMSSLEDITLSEISKPAKETKMYNSTYMKYLGAVKIIETERRMVLIWSRGWED